LAEPAQGAADAASRPDGERQAKIAQDGILDLLFLVFRDERALTFVPADVGLGRDRALQEEDAPLELPGRGLPGQEDEAGRSIDSRTWDP